VDYYFADDGDTEVVEMLVAAGPFTTTGDMAYTPLEDLLDVIRREKPDVVMLIGPFVDEEHPAVKAGDVQVTYEAMFEDVINRIGAVVIEETESTELLLIPSLRDVHHDKVYPQPPYQLPEKMEHDRLHCLANPSTFTVKEMVVGVNTADILMDLSKQGESCDEHSVLEGDVGGSSCLRVTYRCAHPTLVCTACLCRNVAGTKWRSHGPSRQPHFAAAEVGRASLCAQSPRTPHYAAFFANTVWPGCMLHLSLSLTNFGAPPPARFR
jgi:hypothetical protein